MCFHVRPHALHLQAFAEGLRRRPDRVQHHDARGREATVLHEPLTVLCMPFDCLIRAVDCLICSGLMREVPLCQAFAEGLPKTIPALCQSQVARPYRDTSLIRNTPLQGYLAQKKHLPGVRGGAAQDDPRS